MEVAYAPQFLRQFKKLPQLIKEEAVEKIELFMHAENHKYLRVHKLKGKLEGRFSFSVNYRYRIIFMWETEGESVILLTIGDHSIYD